MGMNRAAEHDPKAQADVCPKCGGKLRFERAPGGSGQTVEICENLRMSTVKPGVNVGTCDHWRMLETLRRPELARRPRSPEPAESLRQRRTARSTGVTGAVALKLERVLSVLGDESKVARTKDEVAQALGMPVENAYRYLEILVVQGRAAMQFRSRGQRHRRPKEYWVTRAGREAA
ncbi:MAG: hypothetical protein C0503_00765 [Gemmatimonas sp.]|nr:hypothetical protein [Gemmatimonas sp.]